MLGRYASISYSSFEGMDPRKSRALEREVMALVQTEFEAFTTLAQGVARAAAISR